MSKINPRALIRPTSGLCTLAIKPSYSSVVMKAVVEHIPKKGLCEDTLSHTLATHNSGVTPEIVLAMLDTVIVRH